MNEYELINRQGDTLATTRAKNVDMALYDLYPSILWTHGTAPLELKSVRVLANGGRRLVGGTFRLAVRTDKRLDFGRIQSDTDPEWVEFTTSEHGTLQGGKYDASSPFGRALDVLRVEFDPVINVQGGGDRKVITLPNGEEVNVAPSGEVDYIHALAYLGGTVILNGRSDNQRTMTLTPEWAPIAITIEHRYELE